MNVTTLTPLATPLARLTLPAGEVLVLASSVTGPLGPPGRPGLQGLRGLPGPVYDASDLPDMALIFDNGLI